METKKAEEGFLRERHVLLGFVFLGLQLFTIGRNMSSDYFSFFWYCDFVPGLFALLFFLKKEQAVKGLVNIGLFAQLGYILILAAHLLFNITLFGFLINFPLTFWYVSASIIVHCSTLVAFLATLRIQPKRSALGYSLLFLVGIYAVVLAMTERVAEPWGNYNFIYDLGVLNSLGVYTELWVLFAFALVAIPTHFFQLGIFKFLQDKKTQHEGLGRREFFTPSSR